MASGGCGAAQRSPVPAHAEGRRADGRALALAEPVADLLAQARNVLASAAPFDPATSTRRFVIGAPDGSVFLRPLLAVLRDRAPGIDIGLRQLMPPQGGHSVERAWTPVFAQLEAGGHRYRGRADRSPAAALRGPHDLRRGFCRGRPCAPPVRRAADAAALLPEPASGGVDYRRSLRHRRCRIGRAGSRPPCRAYRAGFCLGTCDGGRNRFDCGDAAAFVAMHAAHFAVVSRELPLHLRTFSIQAAVPKVALMDAGLAWCSTRWSRRAQGGRDAGQTPGGGSRRVMSGLSTKLPAALVAAHSAMRSQPRLRHRRQALDRSASRPRAVRRGGGGQ